jgi:hypothetical protein
MCECVCECVCGIGRVSLSVCRRVLLTGSNYHNLQGAITNGYEPTAEVVMLHMGEVNPGVLIWEEALVLPS